MTTWTILFILMLPCYRAENDGIFECGTHGRFEYCIDGIPGCVIGCHCHPGYYFDTETKICEPNSKLTQNYRRHYLPEPTRVHEPTYFSIVTQTEPLPTLTTVNIIDEQVNDITKNADDLGDWLYNQFFKTIENQVINNTNKDQLTRRSGQSSLSKYKKLKRRARKKGKRHKTKKHGMKEKLLRITEDDSLFQSSDSDDSDSDDSDYSRSEYISDSNSDEDHGHKKIVLINKKPKPPLPSFIFLPNINTPYYPPIGLPPPPVMPMYPMVPVPPMMPAPMLPFPGNVPECEENQTTVTTAAVTNPTTNVTVVTTETISTTTETVIATNAETITDTPSTTAPGQRSYYKGRKRKKIKPLENIPDEDEEPLLDIYDPSRNSRHKLMKLLRQKIKHPKIEDLTLKKQKSPFDNYMNQLIPPDTLMDNELSEDSIIKNEKLSLPNLETIPDQESVDFKYLSQLIHRVSENQTESDPAHERLQNFPKTIIPSKWSHINNRDVNVPLESGRRIDQHINNSRNNHAEDSYYSNLGKQIASLIRSIDADKERQLNIEIEQQKTYNHPYLHENGPRTYWERSVRSPLRLFHSIKNRFDNLKNSNELLFNIENKVETIASTVPTLSLQQLENLINVMETTRSKFQSNSDVKNVKPITKTLNVNLWPQEIKKTKKSTKNQSRFTNPKGFNIQRRKASNSNSTSSGSKIFNDKLKNIDVHNVYPFTDRVKGHMLNDFFINSVLPVQLPSKNISKMHLQPMYNLKEKNTLLSSKNHPVMNPTILNYKNMKKYFFDNTNQYSFQNDADLVHFSQGSRQSKPQMSSLVASPHFHHEITHIDYIP